MIPFPLTEIQGAYLAGRSPRLPLGGVMCHWYFELTVPDLDVARLAAAIREVVRRHEMLRTVAAARGTQVTLPEVPPFEVDVVALGTLGDEEHAHRVAAERERISHRVADPTSWPLFAVRALVAANRPAIVQFSFDMLTVDAESVRLIGEELSALYHDGGAGLEQPRARFADYARARASARSDPAYQEALGYWRARLDSLPPPPALPVARPVAAGAAPRFSRRSARVDAPTWRLLRDRARSEGLTPSRLLCAAFVEVLRRFSERPDFAITVTTSARRTCGEDTTRTVGEYTSPLLLEASGGTSFLDRARALHDRLSRDLAHGQVTSIEVLRELARTRAGGSPISPVVFTSFLQQTAGGSRPSLFDAYAGLGEPTFALTQTPQVYLDHQVWESGGELVVCWDVVEDMFAPGHVDAVVASHGELLELLARRPEAWREDRSTLAPIEEPPAWAALTSHREHQAPAALLHRNLDEQCRSRPDEVAVVAGEQRITYRQLDATANAIARELRDAGLRRDRLIGVILPKGWEQVAAALGILRAGGAYLPVDPELPPKRIDYMLERGDVELVVTRPDVDRRWPERLRTVDVGAPCDEAPPLEPPPRVAPDDVAYVIFTSGSTGLPKGVVIAHAAAANTVTDLCERYRVEARDAVLGLSALSFDLSVFDIFGVLGRGGRLVLPTGSDLQRPAAWQALIEREGVTMWNTVPALMSALVEHLEARAARLPAELRLVMLSGDWIPVTLPDRLRACCAGDPDIYSLGGATEASIWSIHYPIGDVPPDWPSIPYGTPLRHQGVHVLDEALEPRPTWVPGDLYISGAGLAEGYWRDPERTAAAFIRHPRNGARLYRTGDRGRYLADGNIEFMGREDGQVKVNGFRVELGEIEATLVRHPGVASAVAQALDSPRGRRVLVAYVVPVPGSRPSDEELRAHVAELLPGYARPAAYVTLERVPVTANGKVDRGALPAPWDGAPRTERDDRAREVTVVALIREVLAFDDIDLDADFGQLGVDSLDVIAVVDALEERWSVKLDFNDVAQVESFRALLELVSPLLPRALAEPEAVA